MLYVIYNDSDKKVVAAGFFANPGEVVLLPGQKMSAGMATLIHKTLWLKTVLRTTPITKRTMFW